ncbi:MAG: cytidine deaminase [Planctomycetes bacterium]|nr:cytidine deaminase [Planctomycetota bacterium]
MPYAATTVESTPAELVFGMVYAVGTDANQIAVDLANHLNKFGYSLKLIRLSELFRELPLKETQLKSEPHFERFMTHMDAGNELRREDKTPAILAECAVNAIRTHRADPDTPQAKTAYLIRSLKLPEEVDLLRRVYGPGFNLIGAYSSYERRLNYLVDDLNIKPASKAEKLIARDEEEDDNYGQHTRDTFQMADVFLNADEGESCKAELWRFVDLVFGCPFETPTHDEYAMFMAYSASLRSGELSRQVGAVAVSAYGDLISVGANEVPAPGGGLYWAGDEPDGRDAALLGHDCNHRRRDEILERIITGLSEKVDRGTVLGVLRASGIKDITEFGRAVHAEMEALLACLRIGVRPTQGTLYVTTFPCHNCARHLVASGISRVVYIEPYPKSKANDLHGDAVVLTSDRAESAASHVDRKNLERHKVRFEPFVGVGPRRYFDLFSMTLGMGYPLRRKEKDGTKREWKRPEATPRIPMLATSYLDRETRAIAALDKLMGEKRA